MRFVLNPFSKRLDAFEADIGPAGDVEFLAGDAGGNIPPTASGVINVIGTSAQGISTSGAGNTITLTNSDATTSQKGVSELATDAESIAGADAGRTIVPSSLKAKLGTQTLHGLPIGAADTAAITWTAEPTNGQLLIGSTGNAPALATITAGTGITITNAAGTITIAKSAVSSGTAQTIGAVTADVITLALGAIPGVYTIEAKVVGFDSATPGGCGYILGAIIRTTGAAASLLQVPDKYNGEDAALGAAEGTIVVSGNNAVVRVTGVAALTLQWSAEIDYLFVS